MQEGFVRYLEGPLVGNLTINYNQFVISLLGCSSGCNYMIASLTDFCELNKSCCELSEHIRLVALRRIPQANDVYCCIVCLWICSDWPFIYLMVQSMSHASWVSRYAKG